MRLALFSLLLVACGDTPSGTADARATADATNSTIDATSVVDATPPQPDASTTSVDCAQLPSAPLSRATIAGARGYHGLAITGDGMMIGSDGAGLIKASYNDEWSAFVPGIGLGEQMDWLADGDLVFATDDGALSRITATGSRSAIAADVFAYGVIVGPDDMIYAVSNWGDAIIRVDPDSGEKQTLLATPGGKTVPHSIDFSPDGRRMYIGTIGDGSVYYVDLDENMEIVGGQKKLATAMGAGSLDGWHDAVGVDACGNLYIPDYSSSSLYRVTPGGEASLYVQFDSQSYPHALVWGTGEHGWRDDALYLPQPYNNNTVIELVIGVPSRDFKGTVINKPAPL